MKVYIAGPMTGIPEYNFPAFFQAARAWQKRGWDVVNPAELDGEDTTQPWAYYLRRDLKVLVDCHAIAVLPGWENSKGASLEVEVAERLNMPVYDANHPVPLPIDHPFVQNVCCTKPDFAHAEKWLSDLGLAS